MKPLLRPAGSDMQAVWPQPPQPNFPIHFLIGISIHKASEGCPLQERVEENILSLAPRR